MIDLAPRSRPLRRHSLDVAGLRGFRPNLRMVADAPPETRTELRTGGGWRFAVGVIVAGYLVTVGIISAVSAVAQLRGY